MANKKRSKISFWGWLGHYSQYWLGFFGYLISSDEAIASAGELGEEASWLHWKTPGPFVLPFLIIQAISYGVTVLTGANKLWSAHRENKSLKIRKRLFNIAEGLFDLAFAVAIAVCLMVFAKPLVFLYVTWMLKDAALDCFRLGKNTVNYIKLRREETQLLNNPQLKSDANLQQQLKDCRKQKAKVKEAIQDNVQEIVLGGILITLMALSFVPVPAIAIPAQIGLLCFAAYAAVSFLYRAYNQYEAKQAAAVKKPIETEMKVIARPKAENRLDHCNDKNHTIENPKPEPEAKKIAVIRPYPHKNKTKPMPTFFAKPCSKSELDIEQLSPARKLPKFPRAARAA